MQACPQEEADTVELVKREEIGVGGSSLLCRLSYSSGWKEVEKVLLPRYQGNQKFEDLPLREFEILSSLNHPLIVRPLSLENRSSRYQQETRVLRLEYLEGLPLSALYPYVCGLSTDLRRQWALRLLSQLSSILDHLRQRRIIHGDIAPENIVVQSNGFVKLIDFAFAKHFDEPPAELRMAGREEYRPPEFLESGELSLRTDPYSIGRIFEQFAGDEALLDPSLSPLRQQLIEERQPLCRASATSLPVGLSLLEPLPPREALIPEGRVRQKTKLLSPVPRLQRLPWYSSLILTSLFPFLTSWLPIASLSVNTFPYSKVQIYSVTNFAGETPIRALRFPAGSVKVELELPSLGGQKFERHLEAGAGEELKLFEDFSNIVTLTE